MLDRQLSGAEYLAGEYSIADIANFAWARTHAWSGVSIEGLDHLAGWLERIATRPAVQRGLDVPAKRDEKAKDVESTGRSILV